MPTLKNFEAVKGLIFCKDKYLILEKESSIGGKFNVPGGRKFQGEDEKLTLKRWVMEDTGLDIEIIKLLNEWSIDMPKTGIYMEGKTYLCKSDSDKVNLSGEHIGYKWVKKEELKDLDCPDWLTEAISKL